MLQQITFRYGKVKAFGVRWRAVILPVALIVLIAGLVWSVRDLGVSVSDVRWDALAIAFLATLPASIYLNSVEFRLCGEAIGKRLDLAHALKVTTAGTIANILPVPASLAIRGKALMDKGAGLTDSGKILGLAATMWVFTAMFITGLSLPGLVLSVVIGGTGLLGMIVIALLIARWSSIQLGLEFALVRLGMLVLFVLRMILIFTALCIAVSISDAGILSGVGIISATVAIVPSGLGVTEGAGALLATVRDASPAAAFLALTLNRIMSLSANGIAFAGLHIWSIPPKGEPV